VRGALNDPDAVANVAVERLKALGAMQLLSQT
jgi:hypothetical protein